MSLEQRACEIVRALQALYVRRIRKGKWQPERLNDGRPTLAAENQAQEKVTSALVAEIRSPSVSKQRYPMDLKQPMTSTVRRKSLEISACRLW